MDNLHPFSDKIDFLPEIDHDDLDDLRVSSQIYGRLEKLDIISWDRKLSQQIHQQNYMSHSQMVRSFEDIDFPRIIKQIETYYQQASFQDKYFTKKRIRTNGLRVSLNKYPCGFYNIEVLFASKI